MEFDNNKPIYIQIADNISDRILSGELKQGSRIPSVREWGAGIGVNPNTVARAYYALEAEGVIRSIPKKGVFACGAEKRDPVKAEARSRLIVFREAGLSKEDALALVEEVYGG